jgi:hypothetical protein
VSGKCNICGEPQGSCGGICDIVEREIERERWKSNYTLDKPMPWLGCLLVVLSAGIAVSGIVALALIAVFG